MKIIQRALVAGFCTAIAFSNLQAQVTGFKLSDYKYRTPLYQSLQLDLDLNENGTTGESKGFHANLDAFMSRLQVIATDKRQHISIGTLFAQPGIGSAKQQNGVKSVNNRLGGGIGYSSQERLFKENYFIEFGGGIGANTISRKNGPKGQAITEGDSHASIGLIAGIGRGRTEYVHDAQAALLILEDLYSAGIIKSKVDNETAYRFAQLITNVKRQRVLDSRRRTVFRLTQVDSFLRVNKLVSQCDAKAIAIINDILFYSFQNDLSENVNALGSQADFSFNAGDYDEGYEGTDFGFIPQLESITDQAFRQHGTIMYARLIPELRYNNFRTKFEKATGDSTTKSSYLHVMPGIQLGYENHNAIDLKWQRNYRARLGLSYTNYLVSKPNANTNFMTATLDLSYELGYYPSSRSVIEGIAGLGVTHFGQSMKATFITPQVSLNTGYFISYNTVLRASVFAQYTTQSGSGTNSESAFNHGIRFYLRHYFY